MAEIIGDFRVGLSPISSVPPLLPRSPVMASSWPGRGLGTVVGGWTTGDPFGPNQGGHDAFVTTASLVGVS